MKQTVHSHTLDNGLVLVAEPILDLESAAFTFLAPAGAVYDATGREGVAHLTCEMLLRGAGDRDSRQLIGALENLGVEHSESVADAHAGLSGATLAKNLPQALEIYADILRRPSFPAEQLEAVRQATLQELQAIEDEPAHKVMQELRRRHYPPPWGRPSLGSQAGVESATIDDVRGHFQRLFQPQGAILGVAGRIDWPALRQDVERLFGDWRPVSPPSIVTGTRGERRTHLPYESNQTQIGISYPSVAYRDENYFQAWGAVGALSGGMSARLFTEVREKRGLCYSVYASYHTLHDQGGVLCYAGTSAERAQETLDVMLGELVRLAQGVHEDELMRLKARIKSGLIMQQESSSARSSAVARDWYHLGRVRTLDEISRIVDELSCQSINAYLAQHPPGDFTVVTLGPQPLEVRLGVS